MRLVTALALALTVVGCTAGQPTRFYTLAAVAEVPETPPADVSELTVGVGPVTLPSYLDRPQLVTRDGANRLVLAEFDSWAEPMQGLFARILAENLSRTLGTDDVLQLPQRREVRLDYQVEVDVTRFDVDTGGTANLDARWWLLGRDGERLLQSGRSTITEPTQAGDYTAAAAALSRALGALSTEIAQAIADQARS